MKQALCRFIYYKVLGWLESACLDSEFRQMRVLRRAAYHQLGPFHRKALHLRHRARVGLRKNGSSSPWASCSGGWEAFPCGATSIHRWSTRLSGRQRKARNSTSPSRPKAPARPIRTGNGASTTSHKERKSPSCSWASITKRNASEPKNTCMPAETSNGTCAKSSSTSSRSKANTSRTVRLRRERIVNNE